MRRSRTVTWHFRMNREGRTCIARVLMMSAEPHAASVVRMQEHLQLEQMPLSVLREGFQIDLLAVREELGEVGTVALKSAVQEYFIHAAVSGASREAVALLAQICRPKQSLQSRIEANFTD